MKKLTYLLVVLLAFSCSGGPQKFKISGTIQQASDQVLILEELSMSDRAVVDSAILSKTGEFKLTGKLSGPAFFALRLKNQPEDVITLVVYPDDRIKVYSAAGKMASSYTVSGSNDSELIRQLQEKVSQSLAKINDLGKIYQDSINSPNIMRVRNYLDSLYTQIETEHHDFTASLIKNNPASMASLMAIYQQLTPRIPVIKWPQDSALIVEVEKELMSKYPQSEPVQVLSKQLQEFRDRERALASRVKFEIGMVAPDFSLPDVNGQLISLASLKGKYVLLDFWASWCAPCVAENPNLVKAYTRYAAKGFEILQVSLDKDRDSWLNQIKKDRLNWKHVSDLKFWDSPIVKLYGINSIPFNLLLDKEGKVIAKDLRGEELEKELAKVLVSPKL